MRISSKIKAWFRLRWTVKTDRQTNWQTDRQTDKQTDKQTNRQTNWQAGKQTDKQTDKQTNRLTNRLTNRQTDWQTDKQTDKQTNRLTIQIKIQIKIQITIQSIWEIVKTLHYNSLCHEDNSRLLSSLSSCSVFWEKWHSLGRSTLSSDNETCGSGLVGKETSRMDYATMYSREDENNMLNSLLSSCTHCLGWKEGAGVNPWFFGQLMWLCSELSTFLNC